MRADTSTSAVQHHSSAGTIATVQAIIIAVGKPFMAKLADVVGRGEAFLVVAVLYVVGYVSSLASFPICLPSCSLPFALLPSQSPFPISRHLLSPGPTDTQLTIASAYSITQIAVGNVFYAFGYTGLQMLQQIIIADMTSLRWRGLVGGLATAPFLINIFASAEIASRVLPNWRRGYVQVRPAARMIE